MAGGGRGGVSHLRSEVGAGMGSSRRESMNVLEVADVLRWREKTRASWSACASYCGRSEADVRKACEAVLKGATTGVIAVARPVEPVVAEAPAEPSPLRRVSKASRMKGVPQGLRPGSVGSRVLVLLADGPMTAPAMRAFLGANGGTLSGTIAFLVKTGRVRTQPNPSGRGWLYSLTEPK